MSGFSPTARHADLLGLEVANDGQEFDTWGLEGGASAADRGESKTARAGAENGDANHEAAATTAAATRPQSGGKRYDGFSTISFEPSGEAAAQESAPGVSHGAQFLDQLTDPTANAREYEVVFGLLGNGGLGLKLGKGFLGNEIVVKGFELVDGRVGPAQACGLICPGDVLCAVGSTRLQGMGYVQSLAFAREAARSPGQLTLTFVAGGFVGGSATTGRPGGPGGGSGELNEARYFIHQQKARYYRPPPPSDDMVYCSLERHRGERVTSFHLNRDDTGEFLLACSVDADLTGPMLFHTLQDTHLRSLRDIPTSSDSAVYLGCMLPSFLGTEFRIMDHRVDPKNPWHMDDVDYHGDWELASIVYQVNVMGRVPNFMKVLLRRPVVSNAADGDEGEVVEEGPGAFAVTRGSEPIIKAWENSKNKRGEEFSISSPVRSLKSMFKSAFEEEEDQADQYGPLHPAFGSDVMVFETLKPSWNVGLNAWTLNFNGRVKIPSKKNFLVAPEKGNLAMETDFGEGRVHLRHGKMSKSRFSVDFRNPMSPLVALGVCCSTFSNKKAVT